MLTAAQFERVVAMWNAADRLPCLLLAGDFWQLPVVGKADARCDESRLWQPNIKVVNFWEQVRCKDPVLQDMLSALRTAVPTKRQFSGNSSRSCAGIGLGRHMNLTPGICSAFSVKSQTPPL